MTFAPVTAPVTAPRVLLLPGWQDSGPGHWQSRWEALHGHQRVQQADWQWPRRGDWMARLEEVLLEDDRPVLLAAHSLGCQLVAAWAAHSRHTGRVQGALLVAPPDTEGEDTPPQLHTWAPMVRAALPFPSIALLSRDDPYGRFYRMAAVAEGWGARLVDAGLRGHLNAESGLGDWPEGLAYLRSLRAEEPRLSTPVVSP
ncbi:MAG: alpha/beta hydrolase [Rubrivivax sp.]|nr:alpha/beta hydrolase [Rubrivivax sp.]